MELKEIKKIADLKYFRFFDDLLLYMRELDTKNPELDILNHVLTLARKHEIDI